MTSLDYTKVQLYSEASSNKIWKTGSGSFTVPALPGSGETFNFVPIPHGLGTRSMIIQVSTSSEAVSRAILPWASGDNRQIQFASYNTSNLNIFFISTDSSGLGSPAFHVNYVYRILVP